MKQDQYLFDKFGIVYSRVGEVSGLNLFGVDVYERVGSQWIFKINKISLSWG